MQDSSFVLPTSKPKATKYFDTGLGTRVSIVWRNIDLSHINANGSNALHSFIASNNVRTTCSILVDLYAHCPSHLLTMLCKRGVGGYTPFHTMAFYPQLETCSIMMEILSRNPHLGEIKDRAGKTFREVFETCHHVQIETWLDRSSYFKAVCKALLDKQLDLVFQMVQAAPETRAEITPATLVETEDEYPVISTSNKKLKI